MSERLFDFIFGLSPSRVLVSSGLPGLPALTEGFASALVVCDANTERYVLSIPGASGLPRCVIPPGEDHKGWSSVERILSTAAAAGLGRDGLLVGVGGGVVTDLTAFAAAVYMRGVRVRLISTTLLGMADAALGGKAGFDLLGIKNLVGAFHVADRIYMPAEVLAGLPEREWKSGMAEVIKTAVIGDEGLLKLLAAERNALIRPDLADAGLVAEIVSRCVAVKGRIVASDPREEGTERALLNLGHTFGHALEAAAGLGRLTHGEAVAWGMGCACRLGAALGITDGDRSRSIRELLISYGYETAAPHPAAPAAEAILAAMGSDKKKMAGALRFVVPSREGARLLSLGADRSGLIISILKGEQNW